MAKAQSGPALIPDLDVFLAGGGGSTPVPIRQTYSVLFKGGQTAGVLISFTVQTDSDLIYVGGKASSVVLQSVSRAITAIPNGVFTVGGVICTMQEVGGGVFLNQRFKAGDKIYLDSISGLGTNEMLFLVFAYLENPAP
jgi:hypothetical protein